MQSHGGANSPVEQKQKQLISPFRTAKGRRCSLVVSPRVRDKTQSLDAEPMTKNETKTAMHHAATAKTNTASATAEPTPSHTPLGCYSQSLGCYSQASGRSSHQADSTKNKHRFDPLKFPIRLLQPKQTPAPLQQNRPLHTPLGCHSQSLGCHSQMSYVVYLFYM